MLEFFNVFNANTNYKKNKEEIKRFINNQLDALITLGYGKIPDLCNMGQESINEVFSLIEYRIRATLKAEVLGKYSHCFALSTGYGLEKLDRVLKKMFKEYMSQHPGFPLTEKSAVVSEALS